MACCLPLLWLPTVGPAVLSPRVCVQGLLPEKKIFEVHIEKGHKHNAKVVLRGEAGYSEPGILPGDVIFVLEQKPHKTFKRIQADLVIEKVCLHKLQSALADMHGSLTAFHEQANRASSLQNPPCVLSCTWHVAFAFISVGAERKCIMYWDATQSCVES